MSADEQTVDARRRRRRREQGASGAGIETKQALSPLFLARTRHALGVHGLAVDTQDTASSSSSSAPSSPSSPSSPSLLSSSSASDGKDTRFHPTLRPLLVAPPSTAHAASGYELRLPFREPVVFGEGGLSRRQWVRAVQGEKRFRTREQLRGDRVWAVDGHLRADCAALQAATAFAHTYFEDLRAGRGEDVWTEFPEDVYGVRR